jgi:hypothetical protein
MNKTLTGEESGLTAYYNFNEPITRYGTIRDITGRGNKGILLYKEDLVLIQGLTDVGVPVVRVIGVTVTPETVTMNVYGAQLLTAVVVPANAANRAVTWFSSNTAVATVNAYGLVTAHAAGTATITARTIDGNFTGTSVITVDVLDTGTITGTVTDGVYGVTDVYVSVWDERGFSAGWDFTDRDGQYEIALPAGGNYKMWFIPPQGVYLAHTHIPGVEVVADRPTTKNVTLEKGGLIFGKVTSEDGVVITNARIVLRHPILGIWNDWGIRTDADGKFTTIGLAAGTYEMRVSPPEGAYLAPARIPGIVVTVGKTTNQDVVLEQGGIVSGTVTDGVYGVPGAQISLWDQATGARGWAWTDDQGKYTSTGLLPGIYRIEVRPPAGLNLAPAILHDEKVIAGQTTEINIVLQQAGWIAGKVSDADGSPAERISINVFAEDTGEWLAHAWTEEDGTYSIALPAGNYRMFIQSPPGSPYLAPATPFVSDIVVTAGIATIRDISLEAGGRVSGRITDPQGRGVSGAHIRIGAGGSWSGATTAVDGSFTTIALLPGAYTVHVLPPEGSGLIEPPVRNIVILPNRTIEVNITLTAQPAAPALIPSGGTFEGSVKVEIDNIAPGTTAYYTLDGSVPTVESHVYTAPLALNTTTTVTAAVYDGATGLWSSVVSAVFTITQPPALPEVPPASVYGDPDGDGQVTNADARTVLQAAVKLIDLSESIETADVNGDGRITAADATLILRRAAGLIDSFPVEHAD